MIVWKLELSILATLRAFEIVVWGFATATPGRSGSSTADELPDAMGVLISAIY